MIVMQVVQNVVVQVLINVPNVLTQLFLVQALVFLSVRMDFSVIQQQEYVTLVLQTAQPVQELPINNVLSVILLHLY